MQFGSLVAFFEMGGHGLYVWLSFAIAILVIGFNLVQPWLNQKKIFIALNKKYQHENRSQ
ncbi:MAG: hypothetical protein OFPII_17720 [Osedax symbiont Rs1]|nr:MAG: hypothetical protein OFPII_17720 [Osedax symbiont Rs1]